jgi:DNA-directed RNA polymerase specialized sigma24 family protein
MNKAFATLLMPSKEQRVSALRGAAKRAAVYVIEGGYYTADQVAERMGVEKSKAVSRLSRVRAQPGPLTWAKLGVP